MLLRVFAGLVIIAAIAAGLVYANFNSFRQQPISVSEDNSLFVIERGWSARRVGNELANRKIIDNPLWFDVLARLEKKAGKIKTGEYPLSSDLTPDELLDLFMTGQSQQYSTSVIPGSMFRQLKEKLKGVENLRSTIGDVSDDDVMTAIGKPGVHPEGQFFSDTFYFSKDSTDLEFLKRSSEMLDKVLSEEWEGRTADLPLKTPYEALVLASIVEKETAAPDERPLIAGVFMSRLRKGMRLQTDPTVIYGLGPSFDGNIRRKDLRTDTPYNTYTRKGLPPTPIAMVGREAIHAVMHPSPTTKLYFVSKGDGTHYFSETVEEHNQAVRKYILKK